MLGLDYTSSRDNYAIRSLIRRAQYALMGSPNSFNPRKVGLIQVSSRCFGKQRQMAGGERADVRVAGRQNVRACRSRNARALVPSPRPRPLYSPSGETHKRKAPRNDRASTTACSIRISMPRESWKYRRFYGGSQKTGLDGGSGLDLNLRDPSIQPSWIAVSISLAMNWPHFFGSGTRNPVTSACPSIVRWGFEHTIMRRWYCSLNDDFASPRPCRKRRSNENAIDHQKGPR